MSVQDRNTVTSDVALIDVARIWDQATTNTFPDLVRFGGRWLCALREGSAHASSDGTVRVIASDDGQQWRSVKHFESTGEDLREFEFCLMPDGRLMLIGASCRINPDGSRGVHTSYVSFSHDGASWSELAAVTRPEESMWMKRASAVDGRCYSVGYHCGEPKFARLYASADGLHWEAHVQTLFAQGFPNEATLLPRPDGRMLCLLRRDRDQPSAQLGVAEAPYTDWQWQDMGTRIGRPTLVELPDGRILAPVRLYDPRHTVVCLLDSEGGSLTELLTLPSSGDCGYTGAVLHEGVLWIAYYSTHEEKTNIYLAKVRVG